MSNPNGGNTNATQQETVDSTLEGKVKSVVSKFKTEEDGSITFPDELKQNLDPDTLYAATAEHRRRSTQAGFTKGQQALKKLEAEKAALLEQLEAVTKVVIPEEEQQALDNLKYDNPDAWRQKMNELESSARGESRAKLTEITGKVGEAAEQAFELERRQAVLEEFNASAKTPITAELIADEVPPRITRKLAEGSITWEGYLQAIADYLDTGKVVKNETTLNQPNMSEMAGGTTPSNSKPEKSLSESYENDIY